ICQESTQPDLLAKLAIHELDLILSDSPVSPGVQVRVFSHLLGECAVSIFGTKELVDSHRQRFPTSLDGAPFLLPASTTALRQSLEQWFDSEGIRPVIVGEFDDSALLKVFGQTGAGLFASPTVIEKEVRRQYGVRVVG
ncbi:MAG: LysR family transcriptional regulator, partial [Phycisphaerales bacterium]